MYAHLKQPYIVLRMSYNGNGNGTEIDLDIDNYDLSDLLDLFQIQTGEAYGETDLARAKRIVLKMHPDKSRLDSKFFLFYSKAYKVLFQVWRFRNVRPEHQRQVQSSNQSEPMVYVTNTATDRDTSGHGQLLDKMFRDNEELRSVPAFNEWFNAEFTKVHTVGDGDGEEGAGYGDWLTNTDPNDNGDSNASADKTSTGQMMTDFAEKKRKMCQDVVMHQEVESFYGGLGGGLGSDLCGGFSSTFDSFSGCSGGGGIAFQDLRKAHTETMIPVSDLDFTNRKTFQSVDEMRRYRGCQDSMGPMSQDESNHILNNDSRREDENATRRAFRLTKESEESEKKSQQFWKNLRMLKNK
jgi:hypothetical protein